MRGNAHGGFGGAGRGPEKRTIAKAWHRAPARPYYDSAANRAWLRRRGIRPRIARRGVDSSVRLGRYRWTIERTGAWLGGWRRLRIRYERSSERFYAFAMLACSVICFNALRSHHGDVVLNKGRVTGHALYGLRLQPLEGPHSRP